MHFIRHPRKFIDTKLNERLGLRKGPNYFVHKYWRMIRGLEIEKDAYKRDQQRKQEQESKELEEAYERGEIKIVPLSSEEMKQLQKSREPTPLELWGEVVTRCDKIWQSLTGEKRLSATVMTDVMLH